jgi:hypothetical protein
MIDVQWLDNLDLLDTHADQYDSLIAASGDDAFFYRRFWLHAFEPIFTRDRFRPAILAATRQRRLIGVVPLALETKPWTHGWLRRLFFYGDLGGTLGISVPSFLIPDPDDRRPCLEAISRCLCDRWRRRWDLLELRLLAAESPYRQLLADFFPDLHDTI